MKQARQVWVAAVMLLVGGANGAWAQTDVGELVTDRPDFTESSLVVAPRVLQVEMGSAFEVDGRGDDRNRTFTTPLALMRLGLGRNLEFRLSGDGDILASSGRGPGRVSVSGGSDVELGMKWTFYQNPSNGFALGIIPMLSLPVGSAAMTSGTYDPTVKFTWARDLPAGLGLSGNVNVSRLSDVDGRFTEQAYSLSLGHGLTGNWAAYWETYGFVTPGRDGGQAWTVNGGVTRAIGGNLQVDVEAGRGVTAAAPDWFVSFGMAVRTAALRRRQ